MRSSVVLDETVQSSNTSPIYRRYRLPLSKAFFLQYFLLVLFFGSEDRGSMFLKSNENVKGMGFVY
jgi:hypothetical protein